MSSIKHNVSFHRLQVSTEDIEHLETASVRTYELVESIWKEVDTIALIRL